MRWIPLAILTYLAVLFQCSLGRLLAFETASVGTVGPDLLAIVAVFIALNVRGGFDAMFAGWMLGTALDLTSAGGTGAVTVVGPMGVAYAIAAGAIYRMREAFFRSQALAQALMAMVFCIVAHGIWIISQTLLSGELSWGGFWRLALQAGALCAYTAVLMPLGNMGLLRTKRWLFAAPSRRSRQWHR